MRKVTEQSLNDADSRYAVIRYRSPASVFSPCLVPSTMHPPLLLLHAR